MTKSPHNQGVKKMKAPNQSKALNFKLLDILTKSPRTRRELIDEYILSLPLTKEERLDRSTGGKANLYRSYAGAALNDMIRRGIVIRGEGGIYSATEQKPVVIRNEKCERHILKLLASGPMTKNELRTNLAQFFGTDKTLTERDDNKLYSVIGEILRKLQSLGIIRLQDRLYSLPERVEARIDDIEGMLTLKESFLGAIHKRGGEFFEYYFMSLLERYLIKHSKVVLSNEITGGASDGGIDGIITTCDCLGFRETIMVQTKNRTDSTSETDVRSFWGAVCAKQGSRGIFATTADFHYSAGQFLKSIDNCVGVDGDKLFKMALEALYGIKKSGAAYSVDERII